MRILFSLALLMTSFAASAELTIPRENCPVADSAEMLSAETRSALVGFLSRVRDQSGTYICVATVPNLGGISIEEATIKITDQWKIGTAKDDKGVLMLLVRDERKMRIEVGLGLQGELPDATASRIIREVIIPRIQQGDLDRGVTDGVLAIVHYTNPKMLEGVSTSPEPQVSAGGRKKGGSAIFFIFIFIVFWIIMSGRGGRGGGSSFLLGMLAGGMGRGGFGGGRSGGWSGGGGFNGGGASGSW